MIVGLYDADMSKYIHVPFNLELMKLSSYYKGKRDIVSLSPDYIPDKYTKFYYRKDFYDGEFEPHLFEQKNVIYGGKAFNNFKYAPLPLDIELKKPDKYIYERMRKNFCTNKIMTDAFSVLTHAAHLRLSLDGKTVHPDYEKQLDTLNYTNTLFLHDYDLNSIEDSDYVIKDLMGKLHSRFENRLATKFPVQIDKEEDLFRWLQFTPSDKFYSFQFNGLMSDEAIVEYIKKQPKSALEYNVTFGIDNEKDFIEQRLNKLFRQVTYARLQKTTLKIIYDRNIFQDKKWCRVLDLFNTYSNSIVNMSKKDFERIIKFDSLYSFACACQEKPRFKNRTFNRQELRELFALVREKDYKTFKDFYECHIVILKGGEFVPC